MHAAADHALRRWRPAFERLHAGEIEVDRDDLMKEDEHEETEETHLIWSSPNDFKEQLNGLYKHKIL